MHIPTISGIALLVMSSAVMAETYELDPGHTEVRFYWNHAGLTTQSGEWTKVSGTIDFDANAVNATKAMITIDPASLHTGYAELDKHLKSSDFFDVETYPEITFVSTGAVQTGASSMQLTGDLTVKGQVKPAVLNVDMTFQGTHPLGEFFDYYKGEWIGAEATTTLLRSELGVGKFAPLTSDVVELEISAEMRAGGWPQ
ncbi:YceI family protein [uncultured Roseovarius sp.]|uniref:YceI family protein n=1 Tax=uncultured Roseovarius sp. TaxID=293344 RepID=UPI00260EE8A1|nr:YceI family protein [uncultured Roseovarius sp.]